jgi:hypothetical protein
MLKTYRLVSFAGGDVVFFALGLLWQTALRRLSGKAAWAGSVAQESIRSLSGVYQEEGKRYRYDMIDAFHSSYVQGGFH